MLRGRGRCTSDAATSPDRAAACDTTSTPAGAPPRPARPATRPSAQYYNSDSNGAGQFATEAEAKSHGPVDIVVWVNLNSKIYYFDGYKKYGTAEHGGYPPSQRKQNAEQSWNQGTLQLKSSRSKVVATEKDK